MTRKPVPKGVRLVGGIIWLCPTDILPPTFPGPQEEQRVEHLTTPVSPSALSVCNLEAHQVPSTPAEDPFDPASPLTPMSSPRSQDQDESRTSTASPEDMNPMPDPAPNATTRKRKRAPSALTRVKSSRRKRKLRPQENWEDTPEPTVHADKSHADPSIWPPVTDDGANNQTVGLIAFLALPYSLFCRQQYIQCDGCVKWFHHHCVGLQRDREDESPWKCPLCVR